MRTFPAEITAEVLAKHAHLNNAEIQRDIRETEAEIVAYGRLAEALDQVAKLPTTPHSERHMNQFRASAYEERNRDRRTFVAFLERLLDARTVPA